MKVDYMKNEWLTVYCDECGDLQVLPFDTRKQAMNMANTLDFLVGVMTTRFYDQFVEAIIEE